MQKETSPNFRDVEKNLNYDQRRKLDLTLQTLNASSNIYQEFENVTDLFKGWKDITSAYTNEEFKKSIDSTISCFNDKDKIPVRLADLKSNDPNSFLMQPLMSRDHMFSSVIRRVGEDFSVTVINSGSREPRRRQAEEFIIHKSIASKLMHNVATLKEPIQTEHIYQIIESQSKAKFLLNIEMKSQKMGNCFIKQPSNALKFAFASSTFPKEKLEKLRERGPNPFTPKFNASTEYAQYLLSGRFANGDEKVHQLISDEFRDYSMNKNFRNLVNNGEAPETSLIKAFHVDGAGEKALQRGLSHINLDTISQNPREVVKIAKMIKDKEHFQRFGVAVKYCSFAGRDNFFREDKDVNRLVKNLLEAEKNFPTMVTQIRKEMHSGFFMEAIPYLMNEKPQQGYNELKKSDMLYAYSATNRFLEGLCCSDMAERATSPDDKTKALKTSVKEYSMAIALKDDYAAAFAMRGMAYKDLGDITKAERDFAKAKELDPSIFDAPIQLKGLSSSTMKKDVLRYFTRKTANKVLTQIDPKLVNPRMEKPIQEAMEKTAQKDVIANARVESFKNSLKRSLGNAKEVDSIKKNMMGNKKETMRKER